MRVGKQGLILSAALQLDSGAAGSDGHGVLALHGGGALHGGTAWQGEHCSWSTGVACSLITGWERAAGWVPTEKSPLSPMVDFHCDKSTSPVENSIFVGDNQM